MPVQTKLHTVCMIMDGNRVLLIDRRHDPVIKGFIPPGGKIDFPESPSVGAIREVKEETGLTVKNLTYNGLHEFVNEAKQERYVVFNYLADQYEGQLLEQPPEGALKWVYLDELDSIPLHGSFRRRLALMLQPGTFEIHTPWNEDWYEDIVRRH